MAVIDKDTRVWHNGGVTTIRRQSPHVQPDSPINQIKHIQ